MPTDWGRAREKTAVVGEGLRPSRGEALLPTLLRDRAVAVRAALQHGFEREVDGFDLVLLLPIGLGAGALLYLAAPEEPGLGVPLFLALGLGVAAWRAQGRFGAFVLLLLLAATASGFVAAKIRTLRIAAPVIERSATVLVTGLVLEVEGRPEGRARFVVRPTAVDGVVMAALPERVRVTARNARISAGDSVSFKALLRPPPAAAVPDGYDFARDAFFDRVGAVGFVAGPVRPAPTIEPTIAERFAISLDGVRNRLTGRIVTLIGGEAGAVAASLVTGKRGMIPESTTSDLRASGLYHVVSISGLHMAIFAGGVFWVIRAALALSTGLALRRSTKRIAALSALALAAGYTVFSGLDVATIRSFVMTALVLLALSLGRHALTRRNLALAAAAILMVLPEAVLSPGFQMSFAAVAMLLAWYDRPRRESVTPPTLSGRALRLLLDLTITTVVASLATAPFAAFHFHRLTLQSIVSNLIATPIISILIMPLALVAALLELLGFGAPAWQMMGQGVRLLLAVSREVAAWPGADLIVRQFAPLALGGLSFSLVLLFVLRTRLALVAALPAAAGMVLAAGAPLPVAIVGAGGYAALVRNSQSLGLIASKRDAFVAREWLMAMGDGRQPGDASLTAPLLCDAAGCSAPLGAGKTLMLVRTADAVEEDCGRVAVLVSPLPVPQRCRQDGLVLDRKDLASAGAVALFAEGEGFRVVPVRDPMTDRPWAKRMVAAKPVPERPSAEAAKSENDNLED